MDIANVVVNALKQGGPAAGITIAFAFLGVFDLPFPGTMPSYTWVLKPVLALLGGLGAYTYLPRRRRIRVLIVAVLLILAVASFVGYRYFTEVPATPDRVTLHVAGAAILLGFTYLFFGALLRELIATLLKVFRVETPR